MGHRRILFHVSRAMLVTAALWTILAAAPVWAHPPDMYFHTHTVHLSPDGIQLTWSVTPGPMLAYKVWNEADSNQDGSVSPEEALAWVQPDLLEVALDSTAILAWNLDSVEWPAALADLEAGSQPILIHLRSAWPSGMSGIHQLTLYNRYQEISSVNWFYLYGDTGPTFLTPEQHNGLLQFIFVIPDASGSGIRPEDQAGLIDYWDSGTPSIASGADQPPRQPPIRRPSSALIRLVRTPKLSLAFYLSALTIALGLGALHALTPGHGKTLVGAYLVGSRGTTRHAVALGSIVTLTHTGSVLALGLLTLLASQIIVPTVIFPVLEIVSGLLVVVLGMTILRRRWRGFQAVRAARRARPRKSGAGGTHTISIQQAIPVKVYDDVLPGMDLSISGVKWRALLALGVSGGLIPCPDAIAILLVAVAIHRLFLGLLLIVAFSLGLALVLTGIGIALVRSRRLLERMNTLDRMMPAIPMISAVIVIGLGVGLTFNAAKSARKVLPGSSASTSRDLIATNTDALPATSKPLLRPAAPFQVEQARILYVNTDSANTNQLFVYLPAGQKSVPLTQEPFGTWDYSLSPDGMTVAYTTPQEAGGSGIWAIHTDGSQRRQLLACVRAVCTRAVWSPDGLRLIYERRDALPDAPIGQPSVWQLDPSNGETEPVFQDSQLLSYDAQWSFDGQWLSYMSASNLRVQVRNLVDGRIQSLPDQTGRSIVWSPVENAFLMTDLLTQPDGQGFTHLLRVNVETGQSTDLTGEGEMGDTWATWSQDGQWIAVVRSDFASVPPSNGDQVWIMRSDGSEAHPLTNVPDVIHGQPVWSPDGKYLLFQQYLLTANTAAGEIWVLNIETQSLQKVISVGNWPIWLP